MTTSFERSAIIGYWRCGATLEEIANLMKLTINEVFKIINDYTHIKS